MASPSLVYARALPRDANAAARALASELVRWTRLFARLADVAELARRWPDPWTVHRSVAALPFVADPPDAEVIRFPARVLIEGGDCDDKAALAAAVYRRLGFPVRFVLARADRAQPWRLSHIWPELRVGRVWVPSDVTYPGNAFGVRAPSWGPEVFDL